MCTLFMCDHQNGRISGFCPSCLSMAGPAPSMSFTGFCRFSQRTRAGLCLRSYVRPSLAMVSQKPHTNKVNSYRLDFTLRSRYRLNSVHSPGFNSLAAARIFLKLMERLGFSTFYIQGGDWGSLITTNMAQMKPQ